MFTIKLYDNNGRQRILEAESFTILRNAETGGGEITLHMKDPNGDCRFDVAEGPAAEGFPDRFARAIIENAAGRTTEIIQLRP